MSREPADARPQTSESPEYEAPRIETVLTSDEIEREAIYGGLVSMN